MNQTRETKMSRLWKRVELIFLVLYALIFYAIIIRRSLQLSHQHSGRLYGLRRGWIADRLNDVSDAQWRNFRGNLPILTVVFGIFTLVAHTLRATYQLKGRGMSIIWCLISFSYLAYLHGACIIFILSIASINFLLVKIFLHSKAYLFVLWVSNIVFLLCNRIYEGYSFSAIGQNLAFLDNYRGTFRWHICFNFVILRMISFGYDYYWAHRETRFDQKKHVRCCRTCSVGQTCYQFLQLELGILKFLEYAVNWLTHAGEKSLQIDKYSFNMYLCYLAYAPLYIAGPIISFNAFASQLDTPQKSYSIKSVACGLWKYLSPLEVFIIGYGVLNFMWLKFLLIWRYFRFWSLIGEVEAAENMPKCINNCYNLESFWKNWHASFNKWLVRYMYIPLGGSKRKLLNVWVIFTFVAIWHDLEWKLLSWAWLTCLFFVPELIIKSAITTFQAKNACGKFILRELGAVSGAITITCLMVANLVGYVIGPSGINWFISRFLQKDGLPVLGGMFTTFYVGTKLMMHIKEEEKRRQ